MARFNALLIKLLKPKPKVKGKLDLLPPPVKGTYREHRDAAFAIRQTTAARRVKVD